MAVYYPARYSLLTGIRIASRLSSFVINRIRPTENPRPLPLLRKKVGQSDMYRFSAREREKRKRTSRLSGIDIGDYIRELLVTNWVERIRIQFVCPE